MTEREYLLIVLSEECSELAQEVSKALRFGLDHKKSIQDKTNSQKIMYEFNDIIALMELLKKEGCISELMDRELVEKKKEKVKKFMKYSVECGIIGIQVK